MTKNATITIPKIGFEMLRLGIGDNMKSMAAKFDDGYKVEVRFSKTGNQFAAEAVLYDPLGHTDATDKGHDADGRLRNFYYLHGSNGTLYTVEILVETNGETVHPSELFALAEADARKREALFTQVDAELWSFIMWCLQKENVGNGISKGKTEDTIVCPSKDTATAIAMFMKALGFQSVGVNKALSCDGDGNWCVYID